MPSCLSLESSFIAAHCVSADISETLAQQGSAFILTHACPKNTGVRLAIFSFFPAISIQSSGIVVSPLTTI